MSQKNTAATKAWGGENGAFPFWFCMITLHEEHLLGQAKQGLNFQKGKTGACVLSGQCPKESSELDVQGWGFKPLVHVTPCPNEDQEGLTPWG